MLGWLEKIANTVGQIGVLVLWALESVVNALIVALGALLAALLSLLPGMPDVPELPGGEAAGWVAWLLPVAGIAAALGGLVTAYGVFLVVRIGLRWAKAL
jgi:hypothetical protein